MTRDEEKRLLDRARRGDEAAFEALVRENEKAVYNLALKITGNRDDALDISQEVFIKAFTALAAFRGESRFSVWLYRLTQNACSDMFRKGANIKTLSMSDEEDGDEIDVPDTAPTPEEEVERRETQKAVREALDALPEDKREIIVMREFANMSYTEIAESLGTGEGTVKSRISRARAALAEILIKNGTFSPADPSKEVKGGSADE